MARGAAWSSPAPIGRRPPASPLEPEVSPLRTDVLAHETSRAVGTDELACAQRGASFARLLRIVTRQLVGLDENVAACSVLRDADGLVPDQDGDVCAFGDRLVEDPLRRVHSLSLVSLS